MNDTEEIPEEQHSFVILEDVMPTPEQRKQIYRMDCPRCNEPLFLRIIGMATQTPLGFLPLCHGCGFRDWGHVI